MNFKNSPHAGLFVLALPFLAMLYMIGFNELNYRNHDAYRVEIIGYDPRDLLTGHYLTFQYKWPENAKGDCIANKECFACFSGPADKPDIVFLDKSAAKNCPAALELQSAYASTTRPQPPYNLARYNVSELQAPELDKLLRQQSAKFEVGVIVYPDHKGQLKDLYINGQKVSEFFK